MLHVNVGRTGCWSCHICTGQMIDGDGNFTMHAERNGYLAGKERKPEAQIIDKVL